MSLILSGPKRIYVLLLFWQRLADPCATCPRSLARAGHALGVQSIQGDRNPCAVFCRVVMAWRALRIVRRRLIGLSLLVRPSPPHRRPARLAMREWVAGGVLVLAFAACYLGFALLALSLQRHWEEVTGQHELPPAVPGVLRALGYAALIAGLGLALWRDGASFGSVLWVFTLAGRRRWMGGSPEHASIRPTKEEADR
jgi:hypothetical protein